MPRVETKHVSQLLNLSDIDQPDDLDLVYHEHYGQFQLVVGENTDDNTPTILQQKLREKPELIDRFTCALIYGILTNNANAPKYAQILNHIVPDGFAYCVGQLKKISLEKYSKLKQPVREQLLWFIEYLVKLNVHKIDVICSNLLRQIPSADLSTPAIWLTENLLKLFIDNLGWLHKCPELIPSALYTYLRISSDHNRPNLLELRDQEIRFCVDLLREKFEECRVIGRDLVRLLQDLTKIPQISELWKDLLQRPKSFSANFQDVTQLFACPTPRKFFQCRVTPDMENQLMFILTQVKMGQQKRYQVWFSQCFMNTPDSNSLVPDLIRFICGYYHPTNHVLCSDIVPRWAVIGYFFNCVKSSTVVANSKLALFYDWLFFNKQTDNIMNIEPAMLLMLHSIAKYASFTAQLLEFLVKVVEQYYPLHKDFIQRGVCNSVEIMLAKGVTQTIEPLVNCPTLSPSVRQTLVSWFGRFLPHSKQPVVSQIEEPRNLNSPTRPTGEEPPENGNQAISNGNLPTPMEIDSVGNTKPLPITHEAIPLEKRSKVLLDGIDVSWLEPHASNLKKKLQAPFNELQGIFNMLIEEYLENSKGLSEKIAQEFAANTAQFCVRCLGEKFFGFDKNSYCSGVERNVLFDVLLIRHCNEVLKGGLFSSSSMLLDHLRKLQPRTGYYLLLFLSNSLQILQKQPATEEMIKFSPSFKPSGKSLNPARREAHSKQLNLLLNSISTRDFPCANINPNHYKPYILSINDSKPTFLSDCKLCIDTDHDAFFWMLPQLCKSFPHSHYGLFVRLVLSSIDEANFVSLLGSLAHGSFQLLGDNTDSILLQSLQWESFEQNLLWHAVKAECSVSMCNRFLPLILDEIDPQQHVEVLNGILLLVQDIHTKESVETILCLGPEFQLFPSHILGMWFRNKPKQTLDILQGLCETLCEPDFWDPKKAENLLTHLSIFVHRAAFETLQVLGSSFLTLLTALINQYDDNRIFSNLPMIIVQRQTALPKT